MLSVKRVVLHWDSDSFWHLSFLLCNVFIVSLRLLNKTIRTVVSSHLLPFIHWYQDVKAGFGIVWLVHRMPWEVVMTVILMAPASFLVVIAIMTVDVRLIGRRKRTVCLRICLIFVRYIRRGTRRSCRVYAL